jgi:hypothetical protein
MRYTRISDSPTRVSNLLPAATHTLSHDYIARQLEHSQHSFPLYASGVMKELVNRIVSCRPIQYFLHAHTIPTRRLPCVPRYPFARRQLTATACNSVQARTMKRAAPPASKAAPRAKKPRPEVPQYHLTPSNRDEAGDIIWPAPSDQIAQARAFILEWYVTTHRVRTTSC